MGFSFNIHFTIFDNNALFLVDTLSFPFSKQQNGRYLKKRRFQYFEFDDWQLPQSTQWGEKMQKDWIKALPWTKLEVKICIHKSNWFSLPIGVTLFVQLAVQCLIKESFDNWLVWPIILLCYPDLPNLTNTALPISTFLLVNCHIASIALLLMIHQLWVGNCHWPIIVRRTI